MALRFIIKGGGMRQPGSPADCRIVDMTKIYEDYIGGTVLWNNEDSYGSVSITLEDASSTTMGTTQRQYTVDSLSGFDYDLTVTGGTVTFGANYATVTFPQSAYNDEKDVTISYFGDSTVYNLGDYASSNLDVVIEVSDRSNIPDINPPESEKPPYLLFWDDEE